VGGGGGGVKQEEGGGGGGGDVDRNLGYTAHSRHSYRPFICLRYTDRTVARAPPLGADPLPSPSLSSSCYTALSLLGGYCLAHCLYMQVCVAWHMPSIYSLLSLSLSSVFFSSYIRFFIQSSVYVFISMSVSKYFLFPSFLIVPSGRPAIRCKILQRRQDQEDDSSFSSYDSYFNRVFFAPKKE
jgi:hypothetical protein